MDCFYVYYAHNHADDYYDYYDYDYYDYDYDNNFINLCQNVQKWPYQPSSVINY